MVIKLNKSDWAPCCAARQAFRGFYQQRSLGLAACTFIVLVLSEILGLIVNTHFSLLLAYVTLSVMYFGLMLFVFTICSHIIYVVCAVKCIGWKTGSLNARQLKHSKNATGVCDVTAVYLYWHLPMLGRYIYKIVKEGECNDINTIA